MNVLVEIEKVKREMEIARISGQPVLQFKARLQYLYSIPVRKSKKPRVSTA